ncbi:PREDICTED: uncharacterized protein LOC109210084 [Nicotiana attenuata]|uniref:Uncharacterized protein n=1 Tax=Nicotiana attenuata TaxID=49451 RepID=A0A314KNL0_NICAT|nr:PREDICTED: uncharacterized protein LOC109210084 [Nicotiana attenuata]OIT30379.1 hypothetical protein A4A49_13007 [Nicotiana attenuata]
MSSSPELRSPAKANGDTRKILGPGGNRVRDLEEQKRKKEGVKKPERPKKSTASQTVMRVRSNGSVDSSSSESSTIKAMNSKRGVERNGVKKPAKVVPQGIEAADTLSPLVPVPVKRCDWITPNSEPLYISFHDEEYGNPVYDDTKLYELLALSQALAEMTWPAILNKRHIFRKMFDNFDPSSLANVNEKKLRSLTESGKSLLSEPKIRAIIENAKQFQKIQQEFGSFSNYCWRFVNHKPIKSGFRYARQVPAKTPKSELMSKDLMKRGFLCVGPTVVYSFMQVAGIVNDHLITCFRYNECNNNNNGKQQTQTKLVKIDIQGDPAETTQFVI